MTQRMGKSGEFMFIDRIAGLFRDIPSGGIESIGDDAAVIPVGEGESLVVTTDMLVGGVHFVRDAIRPEELGGKSLAVNLSDVASMGARPAATLLSIALPSGYRGAWAEAFMRGYHALSERFGVPLIGGDTTSGPEIAINVVAIGRVPNAHIKRRSAARPGDVIAVTGRLGDSAAGLHDILAGRYDTEFARIHHNPVPCVEEGVWLGERPEVHAMIDLSDGLASDLRHVMERSGTGATVELDDIPTRQPVERAVTGGEDYQLLLTVARDAWEGLAEAYRSRFGVPLQSIGRITESEPTGGIPEIAWLKGGLPFRAEWHGFSHF